MKILLLNDNPVVNKLVTLSAQKTSDELEVVDNAEAITSGEYDLLVVDDTLYDGNLVSSLKEKITFKNSLYICSRDAAPADEFIKTIKKPFLPTDLVELFSAIGQEVNEISLDPVEGSTSDEDLDFGELEEMSLAPDKDDLLEELSQDLDIESDDLDELELGDEDLNLDDLELGDDDLDLDDADELDLGDLNLDDELELDDTDDLDLDDDLTLDEADLGEELALDEDLTLDEDLDLSEESESVLDKDELKEVQDLLEEAEVGDEEEDDVLDSIDDLNLDEELELSKEEPLVEDELDSTDDLDLLGDEEESLDEGISLEDEVIDNKTVDEEEDLSNTELDLGDDLLDSIDDLDLGDKLEEELSLHNAVEEELSLDESDVILDEADLNIEDDLDLGDDLSLEDDAEIEEDLDLETEVDGLDIEDQILSAVGELSQEELDSEVDEETLLDIATSEIDSIEALNSRDLKIAFGEEVPELEEVNEENSSEEEETPNLDEIEDLNSEELQEELDVSDSKETPANEGVEALKNLLAALSDKNVAASMKGMKISINIELGDQ